MSTVQQASSSAKAERVRAEATRLLSDSTFGVDHFVASFPVLVEAAGSTKQLRELLLSLAVRGSLTERLASDDSVDALLKDIGRRRNQAALGKSSRESEPVAAVPPDEAPFLVPETWRWVRLGDLGVFMGGGTPSKANAAFWKGPIPWVSPKDMKRPYIEDAEDHISNAAVQGSAVKLIPPRSLLFVVRGMILAHSFPTAVTTREVTVNQDMKALVLARPDLADFMLRIAQEAKRRVLQQVERSSHGTCRLDTSVVENLLVPLPPLAEQKRIVARVDQLMALIDELEAKQARKREVGARFTTASLEALTSAEGPEEFDAAWKRVAENWEIVIDRAEKVAEVRRAVLRLATTRGFAGSARSQWVEATVGDLVTFLNGYAFKSEWFSASGVRLLRNANVSHGILDWTAAEYLPVNRAAEFQRFALQLGDIVVSLDRPIISTGVKVGRLRKADLPCLLLQRVARVAPTDDTLNREYLFMWLNSPAFTDAIDPGRSNGVPHISTRSIEQLAFLLPSLDEQRRIVAKVDQFMKLCDDLEAHIGRAEDRASKLVEAVVQEMVAS